ncbi:TlpA disulfide reductase family protein [Hyphomonas sp.]|uniref:TlpA family protein disulfide reductase n=1 Tax=Hyphomonas sp. TaxID=87 RepID=UPI0025C2364F|nr:TlpA disulfide reductase family protein [Hyphomonas sp.]MBI1400064.1 redoxin family protein [Hyphomonas sp.]
MTRYAFAGLFLVALAAIVYVLISAAGGKAPQYALERYAVGTLEKVDFSGAGQHVPTGSFNGPDGTEADLDSFKGKTILVNYWATWCSPCEREMPSLGALQAARGGDAFEVVAISIDSDEDVDYARGRLGELGASNIAFRHAPLDRGDIVYGANVQGFPTSILYGPDGLELARLSGEADWSAPEAVQFIDAALRQARKG